MKLQELLEELFRRNVELWISAEKLHYCDPQEALTPELQSKLKQYEATIISYLRRPDGSSPPFYPLSAAQKTIWFLAQIAPHNTAHKIKFDARILSKVDVPAFRNALQALIDRHPSLRTTYTTLDGEPVQQIHEHQKVFLEVIESSSWSREQLAERMREVAECSLDLENGPLLRAYLFALPRGKYIFWLFVHQIAVDFWSLEILLEELGTLYSAEKSGILASLPPLDEQYTDYVRWQLNRLASPEGEKHLNYLKNQLTGELPVLNLPTDRPRPPVQTYNTASYFLTMSTDLTQWIKTTVQIERTSLYTLLISAFFVLLYRYTGQEDILIGAPRSEQGHRKFKGSVGYFENPVPLRADLSGHPTFRTFLRKMHQTIWEAFDHEDYPSHLLPGQLRLNRDASHPQLFQTLFILQEQQQRRDISPFLLGQGGERIEMEELVLQSVELNEQMPIFVDLQFMMFEEHSSLTALWQYNTDLFDESTIERMGGHFRTLLEGIVENPEQRISDIPILTEAERHQILVEWNDTKADYPRDKCIHELFEEQVERTPDAIAVEFPDPKFREQSFEVQSGKLATRNSQPVTRLTYRELNRRANQLAHYLRKQGVGPEVLVGLCVNRSIEMIVGLLGILKAGGAYVPLDTEYPRERLAFMLEDSQVPVLLTQQKLLINLPEQKARAICLDTEWNTISQEHDVNPNCNVNPTNLAYVIYTSGSTGRPKGVAMKHLPLFNLIVWQIHNKTFSINARTLQFAPISFDVSFQEVFSTWCSGGTLILISEKLRQDTEALLHLIIEQKIERLFLPFVALQQLSEVADESGLFPSSLSEIITAGEQLQITPAIANLFTKLKNCTLHNHYGPSESHVVTAFTLNKSMDSWSTLPPIGCPIANAQIYLLDKSLQPVPIGVPGELYIGGVCLARGYFNRPELTDERFILNPFSDEPGARLYKTGDLARYMPDGNIEFLGRLDNQVKIRGFRVELGEIETVLGKYPDVKESVVVARQDHSGNKRLVAYVVPYQECQELTENGMCEWVNNTIQGESDRKLIPQLRSYLQEKLPDYMVPSAFVLLDELPLAPSGKVDRRALPAPERTRLGIETGYTAPRSDIEEILAGIWAEILDLEHVGIYDDFFELGGDSLMATRLVSRLRSTLQVELPITTLFEVHTIAELAVVIEKALIEEINAMSEEEAQQLVFEEEEIRDT